MLLSGSGERYGLSVSHIIFPPFLCMYFTASWRSFDFLKVIIPPIPKYHSFSIIWWMICLLVDVKQWKMAFRGVGVWCFLRVSMMIFSADLVGEERQCILIARSFCLANSTKNSNTSICSFSVSLYLYRSIPISPMMCMLGLLVWRVWRIWFCQFVLVIIL